VILNKLLLSYINFIKVEYTIDSLTLILFLKVIYLLLDICKSAILFTATLEPFVIYTSLVFRPSQSTIEISRCLKKQENQKYIIRY
jgi:hypothetical protein